MEAVAVRSWSAAGSHRRGVLRRTGRRGRRTGTRDTGLRRWQVSRRVRIGQAHATCKPCAPGKWCTSGRRADQHAKWDASFLAGVRFYHIGLARTISRTISGCFAAHTSRAMAEGVSTVLKSTPPGPKGEKRLTPGYPAITATIFNLPEPVITYANWFSYKTADFISENREIYRAIRITRALFPGTQLRFVGDSGLDDQKIFAEVAQVNCQCIFRVKHEDRLVEVYNERLRRWEGPEHLSELAASVPWTLRLQVAFHHAHKTRRVTVSLGWLPLRLPATQQALGVGRRRTTRRYTNVPLTSSIRSRSMPMPSSRFDCLVRHGVQRNAFGSYSPFIVEGHHPPWLRGRARPEHRRRKITVLHPARVSALPSPRLRASSVPRAH